MAQFSSAYTNAELIAVHLENIRYYTTKPDITVEQRVEEIKSQLEWIEQVLKADKE